MDLFRLLCAGRTEAYTELCRLFDEETTNGSDMDKYHGLMQQAAKEIARLFRKRGGQRLANDRQAVLIPDSQQATEPDDFDLVTWLVIK